MVELTREPRAGFVSIKSLRREEEEEIQFELIFINALSN